jgi:hypothetical protein
VGWRIGEHLASHPAIAKASIILWRFKDMWDVRPAMREGWDRPYGLDSRIRDLSNEVVLAAIRRESRKR